MIDLVALGLIPPAEVLVPWLVEQAVQHLPKLLPILEDPAGSLQRFGDLLVWNSDTGQSVIAALEGVAESQGRIESVVANIESATIATNSALGTLHTLSMATLGLTSLSSAFMAYRMHALNKRLDRLATQITDIQNHLNAQSQAHLGSALNFLHCYENDGEREADLRRALEASNYAANVYSQIVGQEVQGPRRLPMLQHSQRCHVLSVMLEGRCLMLAENLKQAKYRLESEQETARKAARAIFLLTADKHLQRYTDRYFGYRGVTLPAMAELYRGALVAGIINRPQIADANAMFEYLREKGYDGKRPLTWAMGFGEEQRKRLLAEWKYAQASVEETTRIASFRLRVEQALHQGFSLREYEARVTPHVRELGASVNADGVCVFGFGHEGYRTNEPTSAVSLREVSLEEIHARVLKRDPSAAFSLGLRYEYGEGVVENYAEALRWYRKSAEQGYAPAQNELGVCCSKGAGVQQDAAQAVQWFRQAAEQGSAAAQYNLGDCFCYGNGVPQDYGEASRWYRKSADQGLANAQHDLGWCYENGLGVTQDHAEAVRWYRLAVDQGHSGAQWRLGLCYESGQGVAQDRAEATRCFRLAADQGDDRAQRDLGNCYEYGEGVPQDHAEAFRWYSLAAEQGNAYAQYDLGRCYYDGHGVPQDHAEATKWYRLAADQGHPAAQRKLGWCCYSGEGVPQDIAEAVRWFRLAADQGDADAQYGIGWCYQKGEGVPQDQAEAVRWYRQAADQGDSRGQFRLGCAYKDGRGIRQDCVEAAKWFSGAAEQDHAGAIRWLALAYLQGIGVAKDEPQAVSLLHRAVELEDCIAECLLAEWYEIGRGVPVDYRQAIQLYRRAKEHGSKDAANGLAWLLATCPDDKCRDGKQAVALATEACEATDWKDANCIDTLAAAYAEAGDFESAVRHQRRAAELVEDEEGKAKFTERIRLYESRKSYRQTAKPVH